MLLVRFQGLRLVASAAAGLALLVAAGCGRLRAGDQGGRSSEATPRAAPIPVGKATREQMRAGAQSANLVICVLDSARADHVGCYGYPRETTPNIDKLAGESVVFRNHFSAYPSTKPSTASLFTGLYPDTHRIIGGKTPDKSAVTLAQWLKGAGFRTVMFSSNAVASPEVGIGGDFEEVFVNPAADGGVNGGPITQAAADAWRTPEGLTEAFGKWLSEGGQSRFFAYCHFLQPHTPYDAPEEVKAWFAAQPPVKVRQGRFEFPETRPQYGRDKTIAPQAWADEYDANLRWADWGVGEVVRLLRERALLDNTLLVVTSDHGEAFGEHGYIYHSHAVYDEFVHIPLVMRFPGKQRLAGEVTALTQTVDLAPTVLDLWQIPYQRERVQGSSLLPLLAGEQVKVRDYAFATCSEPWPSYLVRDTAWSLLLYRGGRLRRAIRPAKRPGTDPERHLRACTDSGEDDGGVPAVRAHAAPAANGVHLVASGGSREGGSPGQALRSDPARAEGPRLLAVRAPGQRRRGRASQHLYQDRVELLHGPLE